MPLEIFGGLVSDLAPNDIPEGASPDNQDVAFQVGLVKTRPGLQNVFAAIGGNPNPTINYLKTYITQTQLLRMLTLDSLGNVYKENPIGALAPIGTVVPGTFGKSTSIFTREYMAFGDGKFGLDIPRQYDDTNFDRVSQVGPGAAPSAADESVTYTLLASPNGAQMLAPIAIVAAPNGLSEVGNVVSVVLNATPGVVIAVGDTVTIAGAGIAGYNGTYVIATLTDQNHFTVVSNTPGLAPSGGGTAAFGIALLISASNMPTATGQLILVAGVGVAGYNGTWVSRAGTFPATQMAVAIASTGLANSGNGTASLAGNISAGIHKISVMFKTRQGYITAPAPPASWTATGAKRVIVSGIPIGPPNVIARILIFTLANGNSFYYLTGVPQVFTSNFVINDNTTTTVTVDFTDAILAAGTSADYLFRLVELGECSGVIDYAQRLFWWGERNKINSNGGNGFDNLTFDGGFSGNVPLGWTLDPVSGLGGSSGVASGSTPYWGDAYVITGDGVTAIRGKITQAAFQDVNAVAIVQQNTSYSVRARIRTQGFINAGRININLQSNIGGFTTTGIQRTFAQVAQNYVEYTAVILTPLATVPSDLTLQLYADQTPTAVGAFVIDCIEIYPTNQPFNSSLIRASRVEDPESYDGVNGIMLYGENDGKRIASAFKLRNNLYFVKETSLWQTTDDGVNEPAKWAINQVSGTVGTLSVNGVGFGTDWVVIAGRTGLYFYNGGEPEKISQEIQKFVLSPSGTKLPGWDQINWAAGQTIWCVIDEFNRRIMVGAPVNGATAPNMVFTLDYRGLDTGTDITNHKSIHISAYTGKIYAIADSRKWTRWNMTINSAAMIERPDGTQHVFMGNGAGTGKIYDLLDVENFAAPATFGDDGAAINSYYDTYLFIRPDQEQQLQLGSHRKLYHYLTALMEGQGTPNIFAIPPGNFPPIPLPQSGNSLPPLVTQLFPVGIASISRAFNVVTVVTVTPHNLSATSVAVINGTGNAAFDAQAFGNLTIINTTAFKFTLNGPDIGAIVTGTIAPLIRDTETPVNILTERCRFRVSTNTLGSWFSFRNITVSLRTDPWAPVRGVN